MENISLELIALLIAIVGAITGVISLIWHIFNSRAKVILERVSFTRESGHDRSEKEVIGISANIRNIGNRSTTIENVMPQIGRVHPYIDFSPIHIKPNSSRKINFYINFTPQEFKEILKDKKVTLGVIIVHTFGTLRKFGWTDFSSDWLHL